MSGHSHWASIKHKKSSEDAKRGKIFSKLARQISVAAREGGDPEMNPRLKQTIEEAKAVNMPKENIERAIKRGTGELAGEKLEPVLFEALGPAGIAVIIEGITDNKNRTMGEIKQILGRYNAKLVGEGAVRWLFERKAVLTINLRDVPEGQKDKEKLEMLAIESGAEDIYWHDNLLDVMTGLEGLEATKKNLEGKGLKIDTASLDWVAKEEVELSEKDKQAAEHLFEALDDNDAVQEIYSNLRT